MIEFRNENDYMSDPNIDDRIKSVCKQAENNYILNLCKNNQQINTNLNRNTNYLSIQKNVNKNDIYETNGTYSNVSNEKNKNNLKCNQNILSINKTNNLLISNDYQNINKTKIVNNGNDNIGKSTQIKIRNYSYNNFKKNSRNIKNKYQFNNNNHINNEMINSINSKIILKSPNTFNNFTFSQEKNDLVNYNSLSLPTLFNCNLSNIKVQNNNFLNSASFCFECDLKKLINDKDAYNKELNIKFKQNKEINNIILTGKSLLSSNKLNQAYNLLSNWINRGIEHPDLFYLYGEVCRKLKKMEDSEKYLILCLDYRNCSPYVYVSLGQLYQEIGKYKYSNQFFKKALGYFNGAFIYYNLGFNYHKLNKYLKSLNYFSQAIEAEPKNPIFYKCRSEIYKILKYEDMAKKDLSNYYYFSNK